MRPFEDSQKNAMREAMECVFVEAGAYRRIQKNTRASPWI